MENIINEFDITLSAAAIREFYAKLFLVETFIVIRIVFLFRQN